MMSNLRRQPIRYNHSGTAPRPQTRKPVVPSQQELAYFFNEGLLTASERERLERLRQTV